MEEVTSLGQRVVSKLRESKGLEVDQLTMNKIMALVMPTRSPTEAVHVSPFDGLPLDETLSSLSLDSSVAIALARAGSGRGGGGPGGSGIDWRKAYRLLSTMEAMCVVMSTRSKAAAPASGRVKFSAGMRCLESLAQYGVLSVLPGLWGQEAGGTGVSRRMRAVPTVNLHVRLLARPRYTCVCVCVCVCMCVCVCVYTYI